MVSIRSQISSKMKNETQWEKAIFHAQRENFMHANKTYEKHNIHNITKLSSLDWQKWRTLKHFVF